MDNIIFQTELGPYYSFSGKEIGSLTKMLTTIQHPYITPGFFIVFEGPSIKDVRTTLPIKVSVRIWCGLLLGCLLTRNES